MNFELLILNYGDEEDSKIIFYEFLNFRNVSEVHLHIR
jgi:hypothetical protein